MGLAHQDALNHSQECGALESVQYTAYSMPHLFTAAHWHTVDTESRLVSIF